MMKRRAFIGGAALVIVAPLREIQALPSPQPETTASRTLFMIEGWSTSGRDDITDMISVRINSGWKASWR